MFVQDIPVDPSESGSTLCANSARLWIYSLLFTRHTGITVYGTGWQRGVWIAYWGVSSSRVRRSETRWDMAPTVQAQTTKRSRKGSIDRNSVSNYVERHREGSEKQKRKRPLAAGEPYDTIPHRCTSATRRRCGWCVAGALGLPHQHLIGKAHGPSPCSQC